MLNCYTRIARQFAALYNSKQSLECSVIVLPAQVLLFIMVIFLCRSCRAVLRIFVPQFLVIHRPRWGSIECSLWLVRCPFEMLEITLDLKIPIKLLRDHHRHWKSIVDVTSCVVRTVRKLRPTQTFKRRTVCDSVRHQMLEYCPHANVSVFGG